MMDKDIIQFYEEKKMIFRFNLGFEADSAHKQAHHQANMNYPEDKVELMDYIRENYSAKMLENI